MELASILAPLNPLRPLRAVSAHCDLPCGVYDPAQARIEAQSIRNIIEKYHESTDEPFRTRAILIKEQRAELTKHHLWVLWTDYFTPEHLDAHPGLHDLFWRATKAAGEIKDSLDLEDADNLLALIDEVADIFESTQED